MKALNRKIDLFCYRHPRFGIRNLMLYVVIGSAIVWVFSLVRPEILSYLVFSPYHILRGEVWRLVTFIIYPVSTGYLALISFYFYYMIGTTLERQWGPGKFTIYFFSGIVLTILYCFLVFFVFRVNLGATASYVYLSMFFAFATLFPEMKVLLFFIIPIKMKWLGIVDALFFLTSIVTNLVNGNWLYALLPVIALLNYLIFCGDWLFRARRAKPRTNFPNFNREAERVRRDPGFKQKIRSIEREQNTRPYTRKCEVCGRTDTDFPDLEFRYCSRCAGFHCFCIDHINDHAHFRE